ncbi:MAG: LPS export ABC transporter periplasmic protein LptC [Rhizobiales bacterium]|nr:LPS export ABC transporter periplasmic protein LptC [Hyphomicrobiales bacterium]
MTSLHTSARASNAQTVSSAMARYRLAPIIGWAAIAAGLALLASFLWQAGVFNALVPKPPVAPTVVDNPQQGAATTANVTGFDKENQPYVFSSETALQDKTEPHKVHLTGVSGRFQRNSGEVITLASDGGLYDTDAKTLDLEGKVHIVSEGRFMADMDRAHVDTTTKKMTSDTPVTVVFGSGTINANGLEITDDGKVILFKDRVRAKFISQASEGDGKP